MVIGRCIKYLKNKTKILNLLFEGFINYIIIFKIQVFFQKIRGDWQVEPSDLVCNRPALGTTVLHNGQVFLL